MKILYITNIPSPYRLKYFEMLAREHELTVIFERESSSERDKSWSDNRFVGYNAIICNGKNIGVDHRFTLTPSRYIKAGIYDYIIITNNISITGLMEILKCKIKGIPFVIEGDGAFAQESENWFKRSAKKFLISGADIYFSTCENHDNYYLRYDVPINRIVRYPFSSFSEKDICERITSKEEKKTLKEEFGIPDVPVLLFVGQFIHRKGIDVLADAIKTIEMPLHIVLVGGDKLPFDSDDTRIKTYPFANGDKLATFYKMADCFVCPSREDIWGLVVNEAMAYGLPVISTDKCNAALELIKDGLNGYVVPAGDANALKEAICKVMTGSSGDMGEEALKTAKEYTIDRMVRKHSEVLGDTDKRNIN